MVQDLHERADFSGRPVPVFFGKGIQGEGFDIQFSAEGDHFVDGLDPCPMTLDPGQGIFFRPAAIAVHDNSDVPGHFIGIDLLQ